MAGGASNLKGKDLQDEKGNVDGEEANVVSKIKGPVIKKGVKKGAPPPPPPHLLHRTRKRGALEIAREPRVSYCARIEASLANKFIEIQSVMEKMVSSLLHDQKLYLYI